MSAPPNVIPEGSIIITPAEVYAKVTGLTDVVTKLVAQDEAEQGRAKRLEAQVAALEVKVESKADAGRVDKLDNRVSVIEKKLIFATGAAAAVGGGIGTWLPKLLGS